MFKPENPNTSGGDEMFGLLPSMETQVKELLPRMISEGLEELDVPVAVDTSEASILRITTTAKKDSIIVTKVMEFEGQKFYIGIVKPEGLK